MIPGSPGARRRGIVLGLTAAAAVLVVLTVWERAGPSAGPPERGSAVAQADATATGRAERRATPTAGMPPDLAFTATAREEALQSTPPPPPPSTGGGSPQLPPLPDVASAAESGRRVIKDGTMELEVDDVARAMTRIEDIALQVGGYVLEATTDYSDPLRGSAFLKVAVPVARFERTMQRIRESDGRVLGERASGVDVSQEYTDTESQIANLEATQERIRGFLEQAESVEEALQVNGQLRQIEGELGLLKGRLQYLRERSAYSTISVDLREPAPPASATPTPSATPSPTSTATPSPTASPSPTATRTPLPAWEPERTAREASDALALRLRALADRLIWFGLALLPLILVGLLPLLLLATAAWWLWARRADEGGPR